MNCIKNISNKEFAKVIKIYILKLIYNFKNSNFEEFKGFEFGEKGIYFYNELEGRKTSQDNMLTYFFLPSEKEDYEKYNEIVKAFNNNANFNPEDKELEKLLEKYGLDLFLLLILNKIISNLPLADFEKKDIYSKFCNYAKEFV